MDKQSFFIDHDHYAYKGNGKIELSRINYKTINLNENVRNFRNGTRFRIQSV